MNSHRPVFNPKLRVVIGLVFSALGILGATSLVTKEFPLALFGEKTTGVVRSVEVTTSYSNSRGNSNRSSSTHTMHIGFITSEGKAIEMKTVATFNTEAKVGDEHPIIYLPSKPEKAKIYSAKQLWLPMFVGVIFTSVCSVLGFVFVRGW